METGLRQQSGTYQSTLLCTPGFLVDEIVISGAYRHHPRTGNLRSRWGSWSKNVIPVRKSNLQSSQIHLKRSTGHQKSITRAKTGTNNTSNNPMTEIWQSGISIFVPPQGVVSSSGERSTKSCDPKPILSKTWRMSGWSRLFGMGSQRTSGAKLIENSQ